MEPGIYEISASEYHADPCPAPSLSSSVAWLLATKSPRHAWTAHPKLNPSWRPDDDSKFDLGTAAHAIFLEGDHDRIVVLDANDWKTKAAREARELANAEGKTALLSRHHAAVMRMVERARNFVAQSPVGRSYALGHSERTVVWQEDGIWLRARPDRLSEHGCIDYKTTENASPEAFSAQIVRMGYYFQACFYMRGLAQLGAERSEFHFLAQETSEPHECSLHALDPALREIGDAMVERTIKRWAGCLKAHRWDGYGNRVHLTVPPLWLMEKASGWDEMPSLSWKERMELGEQA